MRQLAKLAVASCWTVFLSWVVAPAGSAAELPAAASLFLKQHCVDCHGADSPEADLRLDQLSADLTHTSAATIWNKVLDKVAAGEMPPEDAEQPTAKQRDEFAQSLNQRLHAASLALQQEEGRVVLRRLNRIEYETTLRDLFGPQVKVQHLLPDDATAAGFDNVSEALQISSVHLLRYQEAAELAVRSVVPTSKPTSTTRRRTGRDVADATKTFKSYLDKSVRLAGDDLFVHTRTYDSVPLATDRVTRSGRYRVRASFTARSAAGRSLPVMIKHGGYTTKEVELDRRVVDVPDGKTVLIEEEFYLEAREIVVFNGWDLPSPRDLAKIENVLPLEKYDGPALVLHWLEIEGPLDEFPPRGYTQLYQDVPLVSYHPRDPNLVLCKPESPREDAERLIRRFLPIAFRRPVSDKLAQYFIDIAHDQLDREASFVDAMTVAYTAVLCSPNFLYLTEPLQAAAAPGRTQLDHYAVASRLSYFLWSSLPDAELFKLAAAGKLREPRTLRDQVERMLKDPKSKRFSDNFTGQWLALRSINDTTPDPRVYGEFDDFLYWSMPQETERFFQEILDRDLPVSNFVDSDWTFLNQRLAQHYGISGVTGGELRKVAIPPDSHRGGVLTQGAILKITADGSRTSPVLRGTWVLKQLLGTVPPPPPPNIPAIEPDVRGTTTIRQQLDKHRNIKACNACHQHIDPPGFALESFDAIGGWREHYRDNGRNRVELANYPGRVVSLGLPVEMGGVMPNGQEFHDIDDYKKIVLADKDQLARNLARNLTIYSTGADIQFADRAEIERIVADSRTHQYGLRSLLHAVVQSRLFLSK